MNRNTRYRSRRRRRQLYIRRAIFAAIVLALIAGIIVLIVHLASGSKEDPVKPQITLATAAPTAEPTTEPTSEPNPEPDIEITIPDEPEADTSADSAAMPDIPESNVNTQNATTGGRSAHIRVLGDVMFHQEQLDMAKQADGSYDFSVQLKFIAESIGTADYTIANLETTVGKYKNMNWNHLLFPLVYLEHRILHLYLVLVQKLDTLICTLSIHYHILSNYPLVL